jgi:hypothetical protein
MKELNAKNKFGHKLGCGGYKDAMPKWEKKEQELHEAGIPDPMKVARCTPETGFGVVPVQMTADD